MKITDRINFRQTKYRLPAILYVPLLIAAYLIFDLFDTQVAETPDKDMQTTEFLNPELPDAKIRGGDGIGGKYENMQKAWGKIDDYTAIDNIDRDEPDENKEEYESKYTQEDIALLDEQQNDKDVDAQASDSRTGEQEAFEELRKALAEARLNGQKGLMPPDTAATAPKDTAGRHIPTQGKVEENSRAVNAITDAEKPVEMVKKLKTASDYFHTISQAQNEPHLIKAIIDEDIKAVDGSRVRLRLLDDVEIGEAVLKSGTYLYATMNGFGSQRVKGKVQSVLVDDRLVKVNISLYDTDGLEGLYVPESSFRETSKDVASGAVTGNMSLNSGSYGNSFSQWGMQAIQNAYQKTSNAIGKAIKKNKAKLKYGTFVYLVNDKGETK